MIRAAAAAGVDWQPGVDDLRREGQRVLDAALARATQAGVAGNALMELRACLQIIRELRGMDLNHRPSGYAYYFGFRRSIFRDGFVVWTFPSPAYFGRVPAVKS